MIRVNTDATIRWALPYKKGIDEIPINRNTRILLRRLNLGCLTSGEKFILKVYLVYEYFLHFGRITPIKQ